MKNRLTVNTLALGNLKQRRKQYTMMIISIVLAMLFSSSIIFFMFSASDTYQENWLQQIGKQDAIVYVKGFDDDDYKQSVNDCAIENYGLSHIIGWAYTDDDSKIVGASVAWLDDSAKQLSYQLFIDGSYPTAENEVAVEKDTLVTLGYSTAKIGDTIKLKLDVQNDNKDYLAPFEKEYKLVGIVSDKKEYIENYFASQGANTSVAAIFVAQNTKVEAGGKEKLVAYVTQTKNSKKTENDFSGNLYEYFSEKTGYTDDDSIDICTASAYTLANFADLDSLVDGGNYYILVVVALALASCVAIINAFNINLKERKKQIGMLRAVGTTRRQIINIFGREAFIISLIATPISLLLSYGIVKLLLSLISNSAIMSKSIISLPIAGALDICVVMLSALIPLVSASKTSPMQSIRNIDNARKVKTKK